MSNETTGSEKVQKVEQELLAGRTCEARGAWGEALEAYQRAVDLCDVHTFPRQRAQALRRVGHIHAGQNRWPDARQAYEESLNLCRIQGDTIGEADAQNSLGAMHFELGNLDEALQYYQQAMSLAEGEHDMDLAATIFNNQGALANVRGDWQTALACYEESIPRFESGGNTNAMANTYLNMGITNTDCGNWSKAEEYFEKSYHLAAGIGDARLLAIIKLNRAELYLALQDVPVAMAICLQALKAFEGMQDHLGEADALRVLGLVHSRLSQGEQALSSLEKSIQLSLRYNSPLSEAEARLEYARTLKLHGRHEEARLQFGTAAGLFRSLNATKEIERVEAELRDLSDGS